MEKIVETKKILSKIKALKLLMVRAQDYECAAVMRDLEKKYNEKIIEV